VFAEPFTAIGRVIVLTVCGLVLGGCSIPDVVDGSDARAEVHDLAAVITMGTLPAPLVPDTAGLTGQRILNPDTHTGGRFGYLPASDAFGEHVDAFVRDAIQRQVNAVGVAYEPNATREPAGLEDRACQQGTTTVAAAQASGDGLDLTCDVIAASGSIAGERVRAVQGTAAAVADDRTITVYGSTADGSATTGDGLFDDSRREEIAQAVDEAADRLGLGDLLGGSADDGTSGDGTEDGGASDADGETSGDDADASAADTRLSLLLQGTTIAADGSAAIPVPSALLPAGHAPVVLAIPADALDGLLGDLGRQVRDAVVGQTPFDAGTAVPVGRQHVDCELVSCIAITFDDGPNDQQTPQILDILAQKQATATYFLLGRQVQAFPDQARRIVEAGHQIGSHSWDHPQLTKLSDDDVRSQLQRSLDEIEQVTGSRPTIYRPPYGDVDDRVRGLAGIPAVLWDVDTRDWSKPGEDQEYRTATENAHTGAIVLFHDRLDSTVHQLPAIIDDYRARGMTLVTVGQLFGDALAGNSEFMDHRATAIEPQG
jgi:peptidoglycan/xylan/chitin deacetylase (PgdA/CDA1 family)